MFLWRHEVQINFDGYASYFKVIHTRVIRVLICELTPLDLFRAKSVQMKQVSMLTAYNLTSLKIQYQGVFSIQFATLTDRKYSEVRMRHSVWMKQVTALVIFCELSIGSVQCYSVFVN
jgi:hypothetical protein